MVDHPGEFYDTDKEGDKRNCISFQKRPAIVMSAETINLNTEASNNGEDRLKRLKIEASTESPRIAIKSPKKES